MNPSSTDEEDRSFALQTLYWVLNEYSRLLGPFIPFIAEEIYINLTNEESVHLANWPSPNESLINVDLNKETYFARQIVEKGHALRKGEGFIVRQPLNSAATISPVQLSGGTITTIQQELNIHKINNTVDPTSAVGAVNTIDFTITDQLKAEAEARDLVRKIQEERKKIGTSLSEKVNVTLPNWPAEFEEEIKRKALINSLSKGEFSVRKN